MAESTSPVAYRALRRADEAHQIAEGAHKAIASHEDLCAERYKNIHESLGTLKAIIAWGGSGLAALLLAVLAFLMVRLVTNNDGELQRLRDQVGQQYQQRAPLAAPAIR